MAALQWWRLPSGSYVAAGPSPEVSYRVAKREWGTSQRPMWRVYYGGSEITVAGLARLAEAQQVAQRHANTAARRAREGKS